MKRLSLAFLGCGEATAAHSRTLARFRDRVRCFYASRNAERAMSFERRFAGAGSYESHAAALADGRIDAVFVATPPASHFELVVAALRQGKDVLVEKPAFLRARDCDAVARVAEEAGRRVFVAENYCYKPLARTLRALLAAGTIGAVRFVQVSAVKHQPVNGWRDDPAQAGGGALFEGGIHWIDLVAHLGLRVDSARGFGPHDGSRPERSRLVVLEYEGGAVGTLAHSWEIPSPLRGFRLSRILGTEGSIVFESNGLFVLVWGREHRLLVPGLRDLTGSRAMFDDFLTALATGREPLMTLARARHDLELVEAACAGTPNRSSAALAS